MIQCQELKAKRLIRVRTPKKAIFIKTKYWIIWVQIAKSSFPSVSWKLNVSLTHKDTMDRRGWIKFRKKGMSRTQKDKKSTNEKCQVAWECGTNDYFCLPCVTILWCSSWKLPNDKVKMKSSHLSLKRVILTLRFWFTFPKYLEYHQWLQVHIYDIMESRHLEEFNMVVSLLNSLLLKEEFM